MRTPPTYETSFGRVWFLTTGTDSDGAVHEQRVEYRAGSPFPPEHHHPAQDEHFEVESGAMLFVIRGEERILQAGESISIPRQISHKARNASDSEVAVVRWETRPALRTTEFFTTSARVRGTMQSALLAFRYRDVFRLSGPTGLVVPLIAGAARLLGRRLPT